MHIRAKFDGGKVINHSQSGSWEHRCMGAGLQQNLGKEWGPKVWSNMTGSPLNQHFIDTAECFAKKAMTRNGRQPIQRNNDDRATTLELMTQSLLINLTAGMTAQLRD